MNKYTRSLDRLTADIKEIFNAPDISHDTKAICLVLAASMANDEFLEFITPLTALEGVKAKLTEVSGLRAKYGDMVRDFIILHTLQACQQEISSTELHAYINNNGQDVAKIAQDLPPALSSEILSALQVSQLDNTEGFTAATQQATAFLVAKLSLNSTDHLNAVTDTFVHCRARATPVLAYYATIYAIENILASNGLSGNEAILYSKKIAKQALDKFIQLENNKQILHVYKKSANHSS